MLSVEESKQQQQQKRELDGDDIESPIEHCSAEFSAVTSHRPE
jgi:hypothetical protein